jgi:heptosyltransferase-2
MTPALPRRAGTSPEILGVRLCNWVGEVVLMIPALRRLEEAGYSLQLVGRGWAGPLLEGTGWSVTKRPGPLLQARRTWRDLRLSLGAEHPKALLFTRSLSSAFETRFAGWQPIGHAKDGRTPLLTRAFPYRPYTHASRMYWDLVSAALGDSAPYPTDVQLSPSQRQQAIAVQLLQQHGVEPGNFVLLCPFSGADDHQSLKVWPGFQELGPRLRQAGT